MIGKIDKTPQLSLFEVPLVQFINMKHELVELSRQIDWDAIEKQFSVYYTDFGRPSVPIRKMVGGILLKQIYNESDESFVDRSRTPIDNISAVSTPSKRTSPLIRASLSISANGSARKVPKRC